MTFVVRSKLLAKASVQVGNSGTAMTKILTGTVSACVPVINASSVNSGSMAITGASTGDAVFLSGSDADNGVFVYAAVVTADGAITASYGNIGAQTAASTMTFSYLVVGT